MARRTDQRAELLADILATAVEGGINSWARIAQWRWSCDGTLYGRGATPFTPHETSVMVYEVGDDPDDAESVEPVHVTIDTVARGAGLFLASDALRRNLPHLAAFLRTNGDDGDCDALDASALVELGMFGQVRYC